MNLLFKEILHNPILWLLVFVPLVFAAEQVRPEAQTMLFVLSILAIVPLAALLSHATESVAAKTGDNVGGLVGLCALNELCLNGAPAYLKGYISFNTPYGSVESAKKAIESAPAVLAAWRDVAPGSSFLERLYRGSAAGKIPVHLFFGYETGKSGDGTITLQSQLEHKIQFVAHKTYGFNASHVGILNDDQARQAFYRILRDMDGNNPLFKKNSPSNHNH